MDPEQCKLTLSSLKKPNPRNLIASVATIALFLCGLLCLCSPGLAQGKSQAANRSAAKNPGTPTALEAQPFFFALSVRDAEASATWYQRVFGFEVVRSVDLEQRGLRIRILRREGAVLELIESEQARSLGEIDPEIAKRYQVHGVFKIGMVVYNLDTTVNILNALEVPLRGDVVTESDGSMRSLQVEDPDGNVIQIFERL